MESDIGTARGGGVHFEAEANSITVWVLHEPPLCIHDRTVFFRNDLNAMDREGKGTSFHHLNGN